MKLAPSQSCAFDRIEAVGRAARFLQERGDAEIADVGSALAQWLRGRSGEPLERFLGIKREAGQRSIQTALALHRRDDRVRQAAAAHFRSDCASDQARELHRRWSRYAASSWPRERALDELPAHRRNTAEGEFWTIMKIRDHVLSERSIRALLAAS